MSNRSAKPPDLLTVAEVAVLFHVTSKSVMLWVRTKLLDSIETDISNPQFFASDVYDLYSLHAELIGTDQLTSTEVAKLFGVSQKSVNTWARRGRLHTTRTTSGQYLFSAREVQRLLAEQRDPATIDPNPKGS